MQLPPPIKAQYVDIVEFVSVSPALCDNSRGKGYNELILINDAIRQSDLINKTKAFFKVTGRYPIYNLSSFVKAASIAIDKGFDLYCDIKDHKIYDFINPSWGGHSFDCRLYGCTTKFFLDQVMPKIGVCDDYKGLILEDMMFKVVKDAKMPMSVRFAREPHFGGVAGHSGCGVGFSQSNDDFKQKVKRAIGNFIRIFMPWLKF